MIKVYALMAALLACSGCTVARVGNLQVHLLCKQDVITRDGMSLRFQEQGLHHNHCDKHQPLSFTYSFAVH